MIKRGIMVVILTVSMLSLNLIINLAHSDKEESEVIQKEKLQSKAATNVEVLLEKSEDAEEDLNEEVQTSVKVETKVVDKKADNNVKKKDTVNLNNSINKEFPKVEKIINKKIILVNRCGETAQALEYIYEDRNYIYYLNSISSECIYITVYGKEYTLKSVINDAILTIYELEDNGFRFIKKSKNLVEK